MLTTLREFHALSNAQASQALPVAFEATVTYRGYEQILFVQDGDVPAFVLDGNDANLVPGDRVLVSGRTRESFHPIVIPDSVMVLRHGELPKPVPATFDELIRGKYDCRLVTVHAVIRTADSDVNSNLRGIYIQMLADGGYVDAAVDNADADTFRGLLDAEVEVTGVAGGKFDGKMQQIGIMLHVSSPANVKILKRAKDSAQSIPVTPMSDILAGYNMLDRTRRVRVHGTITYYKPGSVVVLQNGSKSEWVATLSRDPFQIGDVADAIGFPDTRNSSLVLTHGSVEDSHVQATITPQPATWRQLAFWSANKPDGHLYDLVSTEGQVVTEVRGATQDEYVLTSDGQLFSAIYVHPDADRRIPLPPLKQVAPGSRIRVTGICKNEDTYTFNTYEDVPFDILLRSFDDIAVVDRPSPVNMRNLIRMVSVLLVVVVAVGSWGWLLRRKVRNQTAIISKRIEAEVALQRRTTQLEQRRSRILEDINGARPLAEVLEEIAELVSIGLDGVPCWCEVSDGARLGNLRLDVETARIIRQEIPARSGPPLGALSCGFDAGSLASAQESETLVVGVRLATLAIETHRLYTELRHRSEFDQLTGIQNRFSFDKHLDALIQEARFHARAFGLIYIDLDEFKQVNDVCGHQVGDQYLLQAAERMKQQIRPHDLLARVGGDEFAVLVSPVCNRMEIEEIALRLERCFNDPFDADDNILLGAASVGIAHYPEDATSKDGLLTAADAAMYAAKNAKKQLAHILGTQREHALASKVRA